ncbi:MAG TPA: MATE family efflux transporter, partial [Bacteroidales bacterium]|nr:MATE family efflux transporter [Bacteroidales bacterium]
MKQLPSYRQIWRISYPLILSLLAQNVINVTDTAFMGRVGEVELGATAIAGIFYVVLYMLGFGFSIG